MKVWKTGFTINALPLANLLSGLVDVLDVRWQDNAVMFFVRPRCFELFKHGLLRGVEVPNYRASKEPLLVDLPENE